jgi:hypothetical protein
MYIYRSDEIATKGSDSSKYQSTTCSLLDLSSLAITTSVIVPTPYNSLDNLKNLAIFCRQLGVCAVLETDKTLWFQCG